MTYDYQKTGRYFAQVADDIKDIAERELISLGAEEVKPAFRGIYFSADARVLYAVNFQACLITRVLAPLMFFDCHADKYLYKRASDIQWEDFLDPSQTFAIFATVSNSNIKHSKFAALRLKDAIVDYFRERTGERPSIDTRHPDVWINLHIYNNKAIISLDTSGGSLHRRSYREESVEAPMMETLAGAIIQNSGWDGETPLYDPFCGSGTLLCEAYLHASRTPSGIMRKAFGFERLPDFDADIWKQVKAEGLAGILPVPKHLIFGSDIDSNAVKSARQNCANIDKNHTIEITHSDVFDIENLENHTIVCNPPYGVRMGKHWDLNNFYKRFGDFLKKRCHGSDVYIYFGDQQYLNAIGLRPKWKREISNGGLDGRLAMFKMF